jgi:alpha 1,2-mannosyltransferase
MPHNYVDVMREAHHGFVSDIRFEHQASHESLNLPYKAGTRGIVSTAGGSYLVVFVISLRMLRRTGCTLPVEVFLANLDEYETHICDVVLPTLHAKCIVLSHILDAVPAMVEISRYQYKIFSILFSSFEEVLLLDSDAFPVRDPAVLFNSEPFNSTGLVLWPDFWYASESLAYFTISSQPIPSLQERPSTESGEIMYSKTKHELSLLLATYYNIYGPTHYYPLQSQGAPGEGDKETYGWAAEALGMPVYRVKQPVRAIGIFNPQTGSLEGSAMVQYDPRDDYISTTRKNRSISFGRAKSTDTDPSAAPARPRPFFVHANFPKFNPATIWADPGPTHDADGRFRRVWEDDDTIKGFGFDVEKSFWEEIKWTSCELETKIDTWRGIVGICNAATRYWNEVFGQP